MKIVKEKYIQCFLTNQLLSIGKIFNELYSDVIFFKK